MRIRRLQKSRALLPRVSSCAGWDFSFFVLLVLVRRILRRGLFTVGKALSAARSVPFRGRGAGHFCLQICPPLEAFGDFLLESEGSRLIEDAAAQLLRQVLLRDVCLRDRMGILIALVVAEVLHQARGSIPNVHWNLRGGGLARGLQGSAQSAIRRVRFRRRC